ncbi:MAG: tRNA (guanine-N7-)-methyltransferase [Halioglobus sp.]|jgi:tRNA (guanine-N7-)-methyltransferase
MPEPQLQINVVLRGSRNPLPANSRAVQSHQHNTHPKLPHLVRRHLAHPHRKPIANHSHTAFERLINNLKENKRPIILDSFCGTGQSTATLALRHPGHLVVGVDKSAHRLERHITNGADNYLLLQGDCEDIWQLLLRDGIAVDFHYIFYPNPWPKSRHLQRRVHGSAAFSWLVQLGGQIELRSNWRLYVEEFGLALQLAGYPGRVFILQQQESITLFEQKYKASDHELWGYAASLTRSDDTSYLG